MRRSIRLGIVITCLIGGSLAAVPSSAAVVSESIQFEVSNPMDPGRTYTIKGSLIRPAGCASSVMLAVHGLSYGAWAWDFPLQPETYSTARTLAARGYAVVSIDKLGYGSSHGEDSADRPNGYTLTVESYADITRQIAEQLRFGTYSGASNAPFAHVGLIGHSAGAEIVELAAGLYPGIADVLIPTGYQHAIDGVSSEWLLREWIPGDVVRSAQSDYEYFETDPETRKADMYNLAVADPAIVAKDTELANLTPSGEILSISQQPSRWVLGSINVPVLLVLAEKDTLFPSSNAANELALFSGSADRSLYVVPDAGHVLLLHPNAPITHDALADWLDIRQGQMPRC